MLVVVCGPPCSGKSTLAAALSKRTGFPHLEMDRIREQVIPGSDAREEYRNIGYRCMRMMAEQAARAGGSVILDATYGRELHRRELGDMINAAGVTTFLIQCRVPLELALERFHARASGHPAVDLTDDLVRTLVEDYVYSPEGFIIDTSRNLDECLAEVERLCRFDAIGIHFGADRLL